MQTMHRYELTEEQWAKLEPVLPSGFCRFLGRKHRQRTSPDPIRNEGDGKLLNLILTPGQLKAPANATS
jgi:transposase